MVCFALIFQSRWPRPVVLPGYAYTSTAVTANSWISRDSGASFGTTQVMWNCIPSHPYLFRWSGVGNTSN